MEPVAGYTPYAHNSLHLRALAISRLVGSRRKYICIDLNSLLEGCNPVGVDVSVDDAWMVDLTGTANT